MLGVGRNMNRLYTILSFMILFASCKSKNHHSDCMEYGYIGKVKKIVKSTNKVTSTYIKQSPETSSESSTNTYFINKDGNIDSLINEITLSTGEMYTYTQKFQFENSKRKNWVAHSLTKEKIMSGSINWLTDKKYEEKVLYPDGNLNFITTTFLNENFRILKILITRLDESGKTIQNSMQEFDISKSGDINSVSTTNLLDNIKEEKKYKYLDKDSMGNPTEILVTKQNDKSRSIITLQYQYYK